MHIRLELPRARLRQWHIWLIEHLKESRTNRVSVAFTNGERKPATALTLLLRLESLTRAGAATSGSAGVTQDDVLKAADGSTEPADLIIRIGAIDATDAKIPTLHLLFDGHTHEDAMWLALLEQRAPLLELRLGAHEDGSSGDTVATALPALEARHALTPSADAVVSRAIEMISTIVPQRVEGALSKPLADPIVVSRSKSSLPTATIGVRASAFLARHVSSKACATLRKIITNAPHWSVAWRARIQLSPSMQTTLNSQDFTGLPDDGARYFADPFALDHGGLTHVFVEEFPFATERGLISAFTIDADGHCSTPQPVLETDVHLSYPQVFEHAGDIYMLPEAFQSGRLDLYRADPFPTNWVHEACLISEPVHDATVHFDGTRWWLFAATQFLKSASWCALKVYTAEALRGPWHAISDGPLKIDARSSRPAGALVQHGDALWRPTQNCSEGYGHALTWCRVETLTPDRFCEQPVGRVGFAPKSGCLGPHTWNATPSIELIDLFAAPGARPKPQ